MFKVIIKQKRRYSKAICCLLNLSNRNTCLVVQLTKTWSKQLLVKAGGLYLVVN